MNKPASTHLLARSAALRCLTCCVKTREPKSALFLPGNIIEAVVITLRLGLVAAAIVATTRRLKENPTVSSSLAHAKITQTI